MSIVISIVPRRRDARGAGPWIAAIALLACGAGAPGARADPPAPARVEARADAAGPLVVDPAEPRVFARDVVGEQGAAIPLLIEVRHRPGRSGGSTYILGLPKGARLSDADHAVTATEERSMIEVTDWKLADLAVTLQPEQTGAFTLAVAALSLTETGRPLPIARSVFTLRVQPRQARPVPAPVSPAAVASAEAPDPAPAARRDVAALAPPDAPPLRPPPRQAHETGSAAPAREPVGAHPAVATAITPAAAQAASPPPRNAALLARAERLIRSGDISGARLVLEHLVERGDARATFLLAQTCDPRMLRAWRVQGLRPDPERASALYARAAEAGLRDPRSVAEAAR